MPERLINLDRSVVVATDVEADKLVSLAQATSEVPGIGGYKIGLALGLELGLSETVRRIRQFSDKPIIYDHQKAGNDIPAMGSEFAQAAGRRWHAIVGSAIYKAGGVVEMALAAQKMTAQLKAA